MRVTVHAPKQQAYGYLQTGRFGEARALVEDICRAEPGDAEAWFLLGAINGQMGLFDETIACCRRAIAIQPDYADAHYNLAQALMHRLRFAEAAEAYRHVVQRHPGHAVAFDNLGYALQQTGQYEEAVACHRRALQLQPRNAEALNNLGNASLGLGRKEEAVECYRQALQINPNYAEASNNLATALQRLGDYREAERAFLDALRARPGYAAARTNYGTLLLAEGRHAEAEVQLRAALRDQPDASKARSGLLFCLNYHSIDAALIFREHREWDARHAAALGVGSAHANRPDPERRLRIGYVSPDLRTHSVAFFFESLLRHHDAALFETICYADVARPDATTARLQSLAGSWRNVAGQPPARVAEQIREDGVDILVDLAGHTGQDLMLAFARKPAPVQVTYLGYPNTTGLSAMDYRFTDAWADPPGQTEAWHSETLVRLPHGFLCYEPRPEADILVAPPPAVRNGYITFGSFNNVAKVTPDVVALWALILKRVPGARLLLKSKALQDISVRERYHNMFSREGIDAGRVELHGWIPSPGSHLALYDRIDIALDPFPYNGTTTTCEALWMGVPVITLAGRLHAGRVGVSLLSQIGLTEFIAENPERYLGKAVELAGDADRRATLRSELRERMKRSSLCDGASFARDVESAYRDMWRQWCASRPVARRG